MKLTRKFIAALVLGIIVVLGVAAGVNYQRERDLFDNHLRTHALVLGTAIGRGLATVWSRDGEHEAFRFLSDATAKNSPVRARWVWLDARRGAPHAPDLPPSELTAVAAGQTTIRTHGGHGSAVYTYIPIDVPGPREGALELREPLDEERAYVGESLRNAVIGAIALAGVCTMLALALGVAFIGNPVRRLVAKARRVGAGDLSGPLRLRQKDELGELAREINLMCERLSAEQAARAAATDQLRHAERLTTVGKLATGLAHELGTPLNVVTGRARLVADGDVDGEDAKKSARVVIEQAERMTRLIRQLLDFARPRPPSKEPTDLRALAGRVVAMLEPMAQKKGVAVEVEEAADDPTAEVDDGQLQQVVTNLVLNAVQATPAGGRVAIELRRTHETAPADVGSRDGTWLRLDVVDTGPGMDAATRARVFEPFFTTKPVGEGTGLGLSVSWGIVREHGGWLSVESTAGAGARFSVHLPAGGTS
jgi:two-component system, NtrC family, sensor kinase